MNAHQLFAGRAYVFNEFSELLTDSAEFLLIEKLSQRFKIPFSLFSAETLGGTEDFDIYKLNSLGKNYLLKISFDSSSAQMINESNILKNNESITIQKHVDSGEVSVGQPLRFILTELDDFGSLEDYGVSFPISRIGSLLASFNTYTSLKGGFSFQEYCSKLLDKIDPNKWSTFVRGSVFSFYEYKKIMSVYESLLKEMNSLRTEDFLNSDKLINPNIGPENISSNGTIFRFLDCSDSFRSSSILGLCFICINYGLKKKARKKLFKLYCDIEKIEYKDIKQELKKSMKVACCIFLFDSFYKFIIEECIFESSRPKKIIGLNLTLSNCFDICSCLDCYEDIRLPIKEMFIRPIIEDSEDRI
jgi:hypothetical protein